MVSADGRYVITFGGEIYNFRDLRKQLKVKATIQTQTDTEVLFHAFAEWGKECLPRLNGMFHSLFGTTATYLDNCARSRRYQTSLLLLPASVRKRRGLDFRIGSKAHPGHGLVERA